MKQLLRRTTMPLFGALAATLALTAACSSGGTKAAASPTTPASSSTGSASVTAFVNCLKSHGYTPSPQLIQRLSNPPTTDANGNFAPPPGGFGGGNGGGAGSTTRSTLDPAQAQARQTAMSACQSLAPAGFRAFGGGANAAARLTQLRAYASCLSDNGFPKLLAALPAAPAAGQTTTSSVGSGLRGALQAIDRSDPAFVAANSHCEALAPRFGPGGPGNAPAGGATSTTVAGG